MDNLTYSDMCTESHVHMVLNYLQAKMTKHMSLNARREWGKKEAVLIQLFYLVFAQPPLFCVHLFGMIEVKIFILQHENSGELCLNKSY